MISRVKYFFIALLFVATAQMPVYSSACEAQMRCIAINSKSHAFESWFHFANDEISWESSVPISFDVAEVRQNIIGEFWVPMRDVLVRLRDTIGFVRLISYSAEEIKISISNPREAELAENALRKYLIDSGLNTQSFDISSSAGLIIIGFGEDWLSERVETLISQSISIMLERFDAIGVAVRISRKNSNTFVVHAINFLLDSRGNQPLINAGRFSISEIVAISSFLPETLPISSKMARSIDGDSYYILSLPSLISRDELIAASSSLTGNNSPTLSIDFDDGDGSFFQYTSAHVGNQLAFVFDGVVVSTPHVSAPIESGHLQVTGLSSLQLASTYSVLLNLPALPINFYIVGGGATNKL